MSGRGKGGKGLGKGGAKRHRKVLRDNIQVRGGCDWGWGHVEVANQFGTRGTRRTSSSGIATARG
jgi:hypothetical protein